MRYILFDIDGTLTAGGSGGSVGRVALNDAFNEVFGIEGGFDTIEMAGKTDLIILNEAFDLHSLAPSENDWSDMRLRYLHHVERLLNTPEGAMRVLPGVHDVLGEVSKRGDGVVYGLLTGNWVEGARIKLTNAGLNGYFSPPDAEWAPLGAFGEDAPTRAELVPVAWKRFKERTGKDIAPEQTAIIGDTPRDVACAKENGAYAIGVATGPFGADELAAADADVVLPDLTDVPLALKHLIG